MTSEDTSPDRSAGATRLAVAERAARAGAAVAADGFRRGLAVETKDGKTDVVTRADHDAQARVVDRIREVYPDDPIVGEEEGTLDRVPDAGPAWVIDPIDGTNNYVDAVRVWATAVAAVRGGEPVAAATVCPALDDVYLAGPDGAVRNEEPLAVSDEPDPERCTVAPTFWWDYDRRDEYAALTRGIVERFGDLRRYGSAQVSLALVAAGGLDGLATNLRMNPWDAVGGVLLVRRAGGRVTGLDGEPWRPDSTGLVASNGEVHDEVLAAAREADAVADRA